MVSPGQHLTNPITGEHFTFLDTTAQTAGEYLRFDCRVMPGHATLAPHLHAVQEEHFLILAGTLGVRLGDAVYTLRPGDSITLPPRITHQWWVVGEREVTFRVTVTPARKLEQVLEALAGLAQAGKLNGKAMPRNPFYLANIGMLGETYLPVLPLWMQQMGLRMGSLTGRLFGVDPSFARYRAAATQQEVSPFLAQERAA